MSQLNISVDAVKQAAAAFRSTAGDLSGMATAMNNKFAANDLGPTYADLGKQVETGIGNVVSALQNWSAASTHSADAMDHNADATQAQDDLNAIHFSNTGGLAN